MKIARLRKFLGITQAELAERCETSQQQIAKIEGGVVDPRLSTLRRIAEALGCEVADLFYTSDQFLEDIVAVIREHQIKPGELGLWSLNDFCQRKGGIPSYDPLWERVEIKKNRVRIKEK